MERTPPSQDIGCLDQACRNGVLFNISHDLLQLAGAAHPMIVGFVLPKALAGAAQDLVGLQRVQMIGDQKSRCQLVQTKLLFSVAEIINNCVT